MAHEIPYWDYTFLAEDDCGIDGFKVEHGDLSGPIQTEMVSY